MNITLTEADIHASQTDLDTRREVIYDLLDVAEPRIFDDENYGPSIAAGDAAKMLEIAEVLRENWKKIGSSYKRRHTALRALKTILEDLRGSSPTVDEVAVNRALEGDHAAYRALTPREKRAMAAAIARIGWRKWRYGADERGVDIQAAFGLSKVRGVLKEGDRGHLFTAWPEDDLVAVYSAVRTQGGV